MDVDVVNFLNDSLCGKSNLEKLNLLKLDPLFQDSLARVFASDRDVHVRLAAGLLLKNGLSTLSAEAKGCVLTCLQSPGLANTVGSICSLAFKLDVWVNVVQDILLLHSSLSYPVLLCLDKIIEDCSGKLEIIHAEVVATLLDLFIQSMADNDPRIRALCVKCINQFIMLNSDLFSARQQPFLQRLYALTSDKDESVQKVVCQSFVCLAQSYPHAFEGVLDNVIAFMLQCTKNASDIVRLEACEFWLVLFETQELQLDLQRYFSSILPVLLECMVYSDDDIAELSLQENDAHVPDKQKDLKTRHHKAKQAPSDPTEHQLGMGEEEEEDDDDYEDDGEVGQWNLRKCAASSIDCLAVIYSDDILADLLPLVNTQLFHADWKYREAGILALGAIAEGCARGMAQHLPTVIPLLISAMQDQKALVRSITCWSIGRYSKWIVPMPQQPDSQHHIKTYLEPFLLGLLSRMADGNKQVQKAACSALATLESEAGQVLVPYLREILIAIAQVLPKYQIANQLVLFDVIGTLAEAVGEHLRNPDYISLLLPLLMEKWAIIADADMQLFPLFECLAFLSVAIKDGIAPYAEPIWSRCLRMIAETLTQCKAYDEQGYGEIPNKDFIVVSLDLISGIVQGLETRVIPLIQSNSHFFPVLMACLQDVTSDVRTSGFALIGDLAMSCFPILEPQLPHLMPIIITGLESPSTVYYSSSCNNATWATGEIGLKYGRGMDPWIAPLVQRLLQNLMNRRTHMALVENSALTLGRLGICSPELLAPHLQIYCQAFLDCLYKIPETPEKCAAFAGLSRTVLHNPQALLPHFGKYCSQVLRWRSPAPPALVQSFQAVVKLFENAMGPDQWQATLTSLSLSKGQLDSFC